LNWEKVARRMDYQYLFSCVFASFLSSGSPSSIRVQSSIVAVESYGEISYKKNLFNGSVWIDST
jgi:hypothetical protein